MCLTAGHFPTDSMTFTVAYTCLNEVEYLFLLILFIYTCLNEVEYLFLLILYIYTCLNEVEYLFLK